MIVAAMIASRYFAARRNWNVPRNTSLFPTCTSALRLLPIPQQPSSSIANLEAISWGMSKRLCFLKRLISSREKGEPLAGPPSGGAACRGLISCRHQNERGIPGHPVVSSGGEAGRQRKFPSCLDRIGRPNLSGCNIPKSRPALARTRHQRLVGFLIRRL